jgi:peptide/nickel transport system substrate-binding protein
LKTDIEFYKESAMNKILMLMILLASFTIALVGCTASVETPQAPEPAAAASAPATAPATAPAAAPASSGALLVAINTKNPDTKMVPAPAKYNESPFSAKLVAEGKLPAVEERLPAEPMVMEFDQIGKYGGEIRRNHLGPQDANCNVGRFNGRGLVRWSGDGLGWVPAAIKSWESNADGRVWTINMIPGMKWSDGAPFTADDLVYSYEDVNTYSDLKNLPAFIRNTGDPIVKVVKVDDYTVEFQYSKPFYFFEMFLAHGCSPRTMAYTPKHYMKQFHIKYNPDAETVAKAAGFETWQQYYLNREDLRDNPDLPHTAPWTWTNTRADNIIRIERNHYYPFVDQEGNQLPYIDKARFETAENVEVLNLRAVQGEIDWQARHISFADFTVIMQGQEKGGYHVNRIPNPSGTDIGMYFNLTYGGAESVFIQDPDFRIALSNAVDRAAINEISMQGLGVVRNALPTAIHPYYPGPEYELKNAGYEPEKSKAELEQIMGPADGDGFFTLPNGDRFEFIISATAAMGAWPDGAEQICENWKAVSVRCRVDILERSLLQTRTAANEHMGRIHDADADHNIFPNGGNHQLPVNPRYSWASDWGRWFESGGSEGTQPPPEVEHLQNLLLEAAGVPPARQEEIAREIYAWLIDNMVRIGTVGGSGMVSGIFVINNDLENVPDSFSNLAGMNMPFLAFPDQFWYGSEERRQTTQ